MSFVAIPALIGEVVEAIQIEEMPLNGRNLTQLALLVPGVVRGSGNATGSCGNAETFRYGQEGRASLVVNWIRAQGNNFILDGIDNNDALVNSIVIFPPADAIQEFRPDQHRSGEVHKGLAEMDRQSGANPLRSSCETRGPPVCHAVDAFGGFLAVMFAVIDAE